MLGFWAHSRVGRKTSVQELATCHPSLCYRTLMGARFIRFYSQLACERNESMPAPKLTIRRINYSARGAQFRPLQNQKRNE